MAIEISERADGKIVIVKASGKLSQDDYEKFVPEAERLINQHGKIRVLFDMQDFHGWELGALWEDVKFDLNHFCHIERVAMMGETKWQQWMASFCKPFTTAKIHYFEDSEFEQALSWLQESTLDSESLHDKQEESSEKKTESSGGKAQSDGGSETAKGSKTLWEIWRKKVLISLFLSVLGLVGLALEHLLDADTWWYWLIILPLFGFTAIRIDIEEGRADRDNLWPNIKQQLLHWLGFIFALFFLNILIRNETVQSDNSGLISLMLLALTCYFAGIHLHRIFLLVATVLGIIFILASFLDQYIWVAFIMVIVVIGSMFAYQKWFANPKAKLKKKD